MLRIGQHLAWGAAFYDRARIHEDECVADFAGEPHLVGDDDHCHPLLGESPHHIEHIADEFWIEGGRRLVEQHQPRLHAQRAGDRDVPLLPTGELVWIGEHLVAEANPFEQRSSAAG